MGVTGGVYLSESLCFDFVDMFLSWFNLFKPLHVFYIQDIFSHNVADSSRNYIMLNL